MTFQLPTVEQSLLTSWRQSVILYFSIRMISLVKYQTGGHVGTFRCESTNVIVPERQLSRATCKQTHGPSTILEAFKDVRPNPGRKPDLVRFKRLCARSWHDKKLLKNGSSMVVHHHHSPLFTFVFHKNVCLLGNVTLQR